VGETLSAVSPVGRARFDAEEVEVETEGDAIEAGVRVAVMRVSGKTVLVRRR
jgi:membrane-bound ClpP family serine protease